jgi:hypothetical protein
LSIYQYQYYFIHFVGQAFYNTYCELGKKMILKNWQTIPVARRRSDGEMRRRRVRSCALTQTLVKSQPDYRNRTDELAATDGRGWGPNKNLFGGDYDFDLTDDRCGSSPKGPALGGMLKQ